MGDVMHMPAQMLVGGEFAEYLSRAEGKAKVFEASHYRDELMRKLYGQQAVPDVGLPWGKTLENVQFRMGEVSLWAGANGHGKSQLLGNVALGWMRQQQGVVIASFEMKPARQLERFARQFCRGPKPAEAAVDDMLGWMTGRLWFYDQQGRAEVQKVYAVCKYAAEKLGAKHVVIDSLMKLVDGEDDYNGQKNIVDDLTSIARDFDIHIHLVHHIRKPDDDAKVPTKYDAKGAGGITDQVDNVFLVWRNKPKERLQERADRGDALSAKESEKLDAPDCLLVVDKQRNGEWEGQIGLWFHRGAMQYCADKQRRLIDFGS